MTKAAIKERCKSILDKTPIGEFVKDIEDFNFLLESFALCPYFDMKAQGQKITAIQRRKSGSYGTSCFYLIREDGSSTDISYTKMFRKDPDTEDVLKALRTAIDPIIFEFRRKFKPFIYEGVYIDKVEDVDVDHYDLKFREIAAKWIELKGGVKELINKVNATKDGSSVTCFIDESLNEDFRKFHNNNTNLRFLPKKINRSMQ